MRPVDVPDELQTARSAELIVSPTASRHVSVLLDERLGGSSRGRPSEGDHKEDDVGSEEDDASDDGAHGWFINLVVNSISVPRDLWKSLVFMPDGQIAETDRQTPRRGILGLPILPPHHPAALAWTSFMLLFDLVFTAFGLPLTLGFCVSHAPTLSSPCTQVNFFSGLIYTINLAAMFQIGAVLQYDYEDYVVNTDGMLLAACYVRYGRFIIDLLGAIPFVALVIFVGVGAVSTPFVLIILALSLLRLFRLVRLLSLSKIVYMNAMGHGGLPIGVAASYVILLVYMLAVVLNLESCIMVMIASLEGAENSWLVSLKWMDFVDAQPMAQWFCALYWIVTTATTTGYGDVLPHTITEMVVANVYMLVGLIIFGILVGTISNVTNSASIDSSRWHEVRKKIDTMVEWLTRHNVDADAQKKIRTYLTELWECQEEFLVEGEVFSDLPPFLNQGLARHAMLKVVASVRLLRSQDDGLRQLLAQYLRPVDAAPGWTLCEQGDEGDRLWLLVEGTLEVSQYLGMHKTLVADPEHPCLVGDSIILGSEAPAFRYRCFTVRCELDGGALHRVSRQLWELRMSALGPILTMYPCLRTAMLDHVRDRTMLEVGLGEQFASRQDFSAWCESAACISAALLKQPPDVVDESMNELTQASAEDGSLQQLLDVLLEYSTGTGSEQSEFPLPTQVPFEYGTMPTTPHGAQGLDLSEPSASAVSSQPPGAPRDIRTTSGPPASVSGRNFVWKPSRFGRQTMSSIPATAPGNLAATSMPFQEFGRSMRS